MLSRPAEDDVAAHDRHITAATPAPIDVCRRATKTSHQTPAGFGQRPNGVEFVSVLSQTSVPIKREPNANQSIITESIGSKAHEDKVASTTAALCHLSTEERNAGPAVTGVDVLAGSMDGGSSTSQAAHDWSSLDSSDTHDDRKRVPFIIKHTDLMKVLLPHDMSLPTAGRFEAVNMIMDELNQRVTKSVSHDSRSVVL
jgi:hypothetical protein